MEAPAQMHAISPLPLAGEGSGVRGRQTRTLSVLTSPHPARFARHPLPQAGEGRLSAAAKDFEAVFIAEMLAPLFSSVETPAIAGGGKSEEFFKSLLQESYAKAMAERGGFGIAAHVKSTLIDLQGATSAAMLQETR